jgi:hypothetical protein
MPLMLCSGVLLALSFTVARPARTGARWRAIFWTIFFYFALLISVTYLNGYSAVSVAQITALSLLCFLATSRFTPGDRSVFFGALIAIGFSEVVFGILELVVLKAPLLWGYGSYADGTKLNLPNPFFDGSVQRVQGTMGHPIVFGLLMVLVIFVVLNGYRSRTWRWRTLTVLPLAFGLLIAGSRSPIIALIAGLVFWATFSGGRRASPSRVLILLMVFVAATLSLGSSLSGALDEFQGTGSYQNRVGSIAAVPGLLNRSAGSALLGDGFGSEVDLFTHGLLQQNGFNIVDNQYVTSLATGGAFGVALLFLFLCLWWLGTVSVDRAFELIFVLIFLSFDALKWPSVVIVLFALVGVSLKSTVERVPEVRLAG